VENLAGQRVSRKGTRRSPVIVFVERRVLMQTCIFRLLKRELSKFDICGFESISEVTRAAGEDVRLIAIDIEDKSITDPSMGQELAAIYELFPDTPVAAISDRGDEATAHEAIQCGLRGFFPSSIPIDVVIAGFRLLLAGGVYCPPLISPKHEGLNGHHELPTDIALPNLQLVSKANGVHRDDAHRSKVSLTPRERSVLEELQLGRSNKVIARNLGLSENTVKMHVQHVMRKLGARTRTEAVFIWNRRVSVANGSAWSPPQ
jgi:DNA-binding NarL/FixJ family response regulator